MQKISAQMLTHTLMTKAVGLLYGLVTLTFHRTTPLFFVLRVSGFTVFAKPPTRARKLNALCPP